MIKTRKSQRSYKNYLQLIKKINQDNLNFKIEESKITGFIWDNWAWKSTTMKILATSIVDYEGDIYVNNKKIVGMLLSNIQTSGSENIIYQALSIGMNVNSIIDIKTIDKEAQVSSTSMFLELKEEVNREKLLKLIIESIDPVIQKLAHQ